MAGMLLKYLPLLALVGPAHLLAPSAAPPLAPSAAPPAVHQPALAPAPAEGTGSSGPNQLAFQRLLKMIGELSYRSGDLSYRSGDLGELEENEQALYRNLLAYVVSSHRPGASEYTENNRHPMSYFKENLPEEVENFLTDGQGLDSRKEAGAGDDEVEARPGIYFNLRNAALNVQESAESADDVTFSEDRDQNEIGEDFAKLRGAGKEGVYFSLRDVQNN